MVKLISSHYEGNKGYYKILPFYNEYLLEFTSKVDNEYWMYAYRTYKKAYEYMTLFDKYNNRDPKKKHSK